MNYLAADTANNVLTVMPEKRDWQDMGADKHFEYHVHTLRHFRGKLFSIEVDASAVPYAALLHVPLFARLAKYARANHKNQLECINVYNASRVARMLVRLLHPLTPKAVTEKINFVDRSMGWKKND